MKPRTLACACALLYATAAPAHLYTCIDAQGNKTVSDKACPPAQNPGKVYLAPAKPAPPPAPEAGAAELTPQTLEELQALLQARERAAGAAEKPAVRETDAQRHMRLYLERKQQQRDAKSSYADGDEAGDVYAREQEDTRVARCAALRKQRENLDVSGRKAHGAGWSEWLRDQQRDIDAQLRADGC